VYPVGQQVRRCKRGVHVQQVYVLARAGFGLDDRVIALRAMSAVILL
jgi:hypothetical protein